MTEKQQELARIRRIKLPRVEDPEKPKRRTADIFAYDRAKIYIRDGVLLDPERKVLPRWKQTLYDDLRIINFVNTDEGTKLDAGDGEGVSVDDGGPFRLRVLRNIGDGRAGFLGIGAVIEVSAVRYVLLRTEEARCRCGTPHRYEPVPDDTPICDGILPTNFPSHMPKARAMAAKGLKKPESELSFAEIVTFFEKRKNGAETFGGNGAK
jgi:hypothetical protein